MNLPTVITTMLFNLITQKLKTHQANFLFTTQSELDKNSGKLLSFLRELNPYIDTPTFNNLDMRINIF